eukprot:502392-Prorocentrum_minimum.AAC.3
MVCATYIATYSLRVRVCRCNCNDEVRTFYHAIQSSHYYNYAAPRGGLLGAAPPPPAPPITSYPLHYIPLLQLRRIARRAATRSASACASYYVIPPALHPSHCYNYAAPIGGLRCAPPPLAPLARAPPPPPPPRADAPWPAPPPPRARTVRAASSSARACTTRGWVRISSHPPDLVLLQVGDTFVTPTQTPSFYRWVTLSSHPDPVLLHMGDTFVTPAGPCPPAGG